MCGIAGFHGASSLGLEDLRRMTDAIRHRGPDDAGSYLHAESGTALGHRRLSILDLSPAGHQPMTYGDSGLWIVFNGEIYDFVELRRELEAKGYAFRSQSDTEVILAAYLAWGDAAFRRMNGMWALALFDERRRKLVLCRDRFGVKPLYYRDDGRQLVFGSECKAFWPVAPKLGIGWDRRGLRTALLDPFQLEASGRTLFEGVRSLPAGHLLEVTPEGRRLHRWWRTADELVPVPSRPEERAEEFRELFLDACRVRMRSDVPIGTALSGGLDSSSVVASLSHLARTGALAQRSATAWRKAFVHVFPGTVLDETPYARAVAEASGVDVVTVEADPAELRDELDGILYQFEGVYGGMQDSMWRLYRAQRRAGVLVTLDGHGADELLCGYAHTLSAALDGASVASPAFWRLLALRRRLLGVQAPPFARDLAAAGRRKAVRLAKRVVPRRPGRRPAERFLASDALALEPYAPASDPAPAGWPPLNRVLHAEFHETVLPRILRNFDLMSMAHGVEVRMPFMDYRLVRYAFSLPPGDKVGDGYTKLVLRRAMKGILVDDVRLRRTKIGFNSPVLELFRGELRPWLDDVLAERGDAEGLLDVKRLRRYYEDEVRPGRVGWDDALRFWVNVNALRLTRLVRLGAPAAPSRSPRSSPVRPERSEA